MHAASNAELVERADVVLLCVKPIDVERVIRELAGRIGPDKALASVAAGVETVTLESILDEDVPVFRLMPNVGVQVGAGTICFAPGRFTHTVAEERVLDWLRLLGSVVDLPERQFDAATALSGSGPAFIALVVEAFEDAGIVSGLTHAKARELILTTMTGTAALLTRDATWRARPCGAWSCRRAAPRRRASRRWSGPACAAPSSTACWRPCGAPASSDRRRPVVP